MTSPPGDAREPSWTSAAERGSRVALAALSWALRHVGVRPVRLLMGPVAAYYLLFAPEARRASRDYLDRLARARGGSRRRWDVFRHLYTFADAIADRFSFWMGAHEAFEVVVHGREHMEARLERGEGGFLVGAHLGNFEVLRVIARDVGIRVNVLMFSGNAQKINETMRTLDPGADLHVIELDPGSVRSVFEIRRLAERGEFIAVLADRLPPGGRARVSMASFLGRPAPFPQGPFLLPLLLGLPVVLAVGLKTAPRRYEVFLETLAEASPVPVRDREKVLQERVETFASRLEHYCEQAPLQWYNFYDFWEAPPHGDA
ncbi:MAG: lipid A biosynthesis acyltransferase [Myxococcota bacterium]|nr:lipid A biosynthesis acyltransferase [Myxococcota bacterium]